MIYKYINISVYRNTSHFLGAFSQNIDYASSIEAEFSACMYAIERVFEMLLVDIWMETESLIVFKAFSEYVGLPWRMINRWKNCMHFLSSIKSRYSHVLREDNMVADALIGQECSRASSSFHSMAGHSPLFCFLASH